VNALRNLRRVLLCKAVAKVLQSVIFLIIDTACFRQHAFIKARRITW